MTRREMELCLYGLNRFGYASIEHNLSHIAYGYVFDNKIDGELNIRLSAWFSKDVCNNWSAKIELKSQMDPTKVVTEVVAFTVYEFEYEIAALLGKPNV